MQIKDEAKRKKIIEVATKLFKERDIHSVKLDEIAQIVGISKSSIYTYYKSKNELFFSCLTEGIDEFIDCINKATNKMNFNSGFEQMIKFLLKIARIKGPLMAILFKNGPALKLSDEDMEKQRKRKLRGMEMLENFFQKGVKEGILAPDIPVKRMAIVFQSMFPINVEMMLYGEEPLTCEQIYRMFMSVFKKQE